MSILGLRDIKITISSVPYDFSQELINRLQDLIVERAKQHKLLISPDDITIYILYGSKWSDIKEDEEKKIRISVGGPFTCEATGELENIFLGVLQSEAEKYFKEKNKK